MALRGDVQVPDDTPFRVPSDTRPRVPDAGEVVGVGGDGPRPVGGVLLAGRVAVAVPLVLAGDVAKAPLPEVCQVARPSRPASLARVPAPNDVPAHAGGGRPTHDAPVVEAALGRAVETPRPLAAPPETRAKVGLAVAVVGVAPVGGKTGAEAVLDLGPAVVLLVVAGAAIVGTVPAKTPSWALFYCLFLCVRKWKGPPTREKNT